jgi:dTDP-4-amino-4,6-dideoxygalactose transaminase
MIGHNYRMTEVQAAIGSIQLQKLPKILRRREEEASRLREVLGKFSEIELPLVDDGNTHVYYLFAMQLNEEILPFNKLDFVEAITKQGVPGLSTQYLNLHMLPIFQQKIAMGGSGFPWTYEKSREDISYAKGICPVAEMLQEKNFFSFYMNDFMLTKKDISFIGKSFERTFVTLKRTL